MSAKVVRAAVFSAAVRSGAPADALSRRARVSPAVLANPDARVSHDRMAAVWALLVRETGDPALGLFAAQLIDPTTNDRLEPVFAHAPTLGAAVDMFIRYQRLYHTGNASYSELGKRAWRVGFAIHRDARPSPELTDFVLTNRLRRMRRAVGGDLSLVEARLVRPRPSVPAPYVAVFGPRVRFDAGEDVLVFAPEASTRPIAGSNPTLRAIFETHAQADLDAIDPDNAFLRDARAALEASLREGGTTVEGLGGALAMSSRTVQRRLASCGTSFQSLLDDVRRELALGHLARGQSVTDTAFMLGFSELSAFSRAFRRWTGRTPRTFARESVASER